MALVQNFWPPACSQRKSLVNRSRFRQADHAEAESACFEGETRSWAGARDRADASSTERGGGSDGLPHFHKDVFFLENGLASEIIWLFPSHSNSLEFWGTIFLLFFTLSEIFFFTFWNFRFYFSPYFFSVYCETQQGRKKKYGGSHKKSKKKFQKK